MLDEFHERSTETDLVLGMLLRVRATLRPDLRIVVMSATLDPGPVATLLGAGDPAEGGGRAGRGGGGGRGGPAAGPVMIQVEDGFSPDVIKRMRELGYDFDFVSLKGELREGYGAAIAIDGRRVTAGADPRRAGAAGAIP